MELKSEPKYDIVQVTDLDVAFPGGDVQSFTLREGVDTYERVGDLDLLRVYVNGGVVELHLQHAHWIAERKREMRVLAAEGPKPATT